MIFYFIIIITLTILLFIKKSNTIETLQPRVATLSGSPADLLNVLNEGDKENSDRVSQTFSHGVYVTDNNINYELLDQSITSLEEQYRYTNNIINNLKIDVQSTTETPTIDPVVKIYGSFPSSIALHMTLPSAVPGKIGEQGETGEKGDKGITGPQGEMGPPGPFGTLP